MSETSEAVCAIGMGCGAVVLLIAWGVLLPTVGLLYMLGYLT